MSPPTTRNYACRLRRRYPDEALMGTVSCLLARLCLAKRRDFLRSGRVLKQAFVQEALLATKVWQRGLLLGLTSGGIGLRHNPTSKKGMIMRYFSCIGIRMIAFFSLFMAAGCSSDSGNSGQTLAQSVLARNMNPQASDAELEAVVSGNTEFALKLFPLLDTTSSNNIHPIALLGPLRYWRQGHAGQRSAKSSVLYPFHSPRIASTLPSTNSIC